LKILFNLFSISSNHKSYHKKSIRKNTIHTTKMHKKNTSHTTKKKHKKNTIHTTK
jgi:hypothetical protein